MQNVKVKQQHHTSSFHPIQGPTGVKRITNFSTGILEDKGDMTQLQFKFGLKDIDKLVAPISSKAKFDEKKTLKGKIHTIKTLDECGKSFDVLNIELVVQGLAPYKDEIVISWDEMKEHLRMKDRGHGLLYRLFEEKLGDQLKGVEKVVLGKSLVFPLVILLYIARGWET